MKRPLCLFFIAIACAGTVAACGGGGAAPNAGGPVVMPVDTSAPTLGTAVYKQKVEASGPYSALTCVNQQGVGAQTWTGSVTQTFSGAPGANGTSGAVTATSTIGIEGCADGADTSTETDSFSSGALEGAQLSAYTSRFTPNASTQIVFPVPGTIARTLIAGGETLTVHSDGSYTDATVGSNTLWPYDAVTIVQNGDASGSDTTTAGANASAPPYVIDYSAPVNGYVTVSTQGSPPVDPVLPTPICNGTCPAPSPTPSVEQAWYPFIPSASQPLERIMSSDKGTQPLPPSCTVATGLRTAARLTETTDTSLDVWQGTAVSVSDAYVDPSRGLLCAVVVVTRTIYALGSTEPLGGDTLTVTESLQSESGSIVPFAVPAPARFISLWR